MEKEALSSSESPKSNVAELDFEKPPVKKKRSQNSPPSQSHNKH